MCHHAGDRIEVLMSMKLTPLSEMGPELRNSATDSQGGVGVYPFF
jgi:hypothetical protein